MKEDGFTSCEQVRGLLFDFVDGELDEKQSALIQTHIDGCAECAQEVMALRETIEAIARCAVEPPESLHTSVMALVRTEEARRKAALLRQRKITRICAAAAAAAAVLALAVNIPAITKFFANGFTSEDIAPKECGYADKTAFEQAAPADDYLIATTGVGESNANAENGGNNEKNANAANGANGIPDPSDGLLYSSQNIARATTETEAQTTRAETYPAMDALPERNNAPATTTAPPSTAAIVAPTTTAPQTTGAVTMAKAPQPLTAPQTNGVYTGKELAVSLAYKGGEDGKLINYKDADIQSAVNAKIDSLLGLYRGIGMKAEAYAEETQAGCLYTIRTHASFAAQEITEYYSFDLNTGTLLTFADMAQNDTLYKAIADYIKKTYSATVKINANSFFSFGADTLIIHIGGKSYPVAVAEVPELAWCVEKYGLKEAPWLV